MEKQNKLKDSLLQFLHNLFDLMILNWLWLLCCLPVITLGPATCGLYCATLKLARGESVHPVKDFFRGFRENLKQGILLGILSMIPLVISAGDIWFALQQTGWMQTVFLVTGMLMAVIWLILLAYVFALQAMFRNSCRGHILNAFKLAVVVPGKTVALWGILLLPVLCLLLLPPVAVGMLGFLYIVVGFSGPVYGASRILRNIFDLVNGSSLVEGQPISG